MSKFWFICLRREFVLESWLKSFLPYHPGTFHTNPQSWSLEIKLHRFNSNLVQITHFLQEIFSGRIDCFYCVPAVFYLTTAFQKHSQRLNYQQGCIILSQIWPELTFPSKTNSLEKLTNISLVFYVPLCYILSKNPLRANQVP